VNHSDEDVKPVMTLLSRHWERVVQIAILAALLFVNSRFVTREEFVSSRKEDRAFNEAIAVKITDLTTELRILRERRTDDAVQNDRIADHESRIRLLERH
jgi:transcriptional regulator GlxA family with amidase domain